jgi:glycosyltransferase involved in cell wall biosynthesis
MKNVIMTVSPHPSGPFTQFINSKEALKDYGWNLIGLSLNNKDNVDGFININAKSLQDIEIALLDIIERYRIEIFIPISYIEFHIFIPTVYEKVRVIKCATALDYTLVRINHEYVYKFIALTPRQKDDLINLGIPNSKIEIIPVPVKVPKAREKSKELVLGYIGRISHPSKGVLFVPRIYKEIKKRGFKVKLRYIGGGPDLSVLKLFHLKDIFNKNVSFSGLVNSEEALKLSYGIDILIMPSTTEGFGISLVEGMAQGAVPVVTSILGVTDWIVDDGKSGFVVNWCNDDFVHKIVSLLNDDNLRNKISKASIDKVRTSFSMEVVGEKLSTLLNDVLSLQKLEVDGSAGIYSMALSKEPEKKLYNSRINSFIPRIIKDIYILFKISQSKF